MAGQEADGRSGAMLRLEGVACERGGRRLFEGIDLALGPGEAVLVTGANGAGKSSLVRLAAGLLAPVAGRVVCNGAVALMTEAAALDAERPLAAALDFWARFDGVGADRVAKALEATRLSALADAPVRLLSTGQRRRAAFARVLASGAPIWLLDEPTNGLDTASVALFERLVGNHRAEGGIALVATHLPIALPDAHEVAL